MTSKSEEIQWKLVHTKSYTSQVEEENRFQIWSKNYNFVQEHNDIPGQHRRHERLRWYLIRRMVKLPQAMRHGQWFKQRIRNPRHLQPPSLRRLETKGCSHRSQEPSTKRFTLLLLLHWFLRRSPCPKEKQARLLLRTTNCWLFRSFGNPGCNGGLMDYVFKYVSSQSIEPAADYPYTAQQGTCNYKAIKTVFKNTASKDVHKATTTLWLPLLLNNRSRSVLRLTHQHSNCTLVVSSMTHHAEPNSTTMSWLSDMMLPKELTIG